MISFIPSKVKNIIKGLKPIKENPKVVLVVGITGGGTTLISALLDQNFKFDSVLHESQLAFDNSSDFKATFPRLYDSFEDYRLEMTSKYKNSNVSKFRKELSKVYTGRSGFNLKINNVVDKSPNYHCYRVDYYLKTFKDLNIVVIFRDPKENVEGMLRKWPLFKSAGIEKISEFWRDSFENLMSFENEMNRAEPVFLNLNDLKQNPSSAIDKIEKKFNLKKRSNIKQYQNKSNKQGKALRNVKDGVILIDKSKSKLNMTDDEQQIVNNICGDTYKKLLSRREIL